MKTLRAVWVACLALAVGCDHGDHEHGDAHDHGHGDAHGDHEEEGPPPVAITRWTEGHELFVELDPPRPGQPVGYHAHVTILDGFQAVTKGTFTVRYLEGDRVVAETKADGVARAGIFTPEAPAPPAGSYRLIMIFEDGDLSINDAVVEGSVHRLLPILMTALTAALAFIPIAMGSDDPGGEIQGPMAAVILGGLASSTLLNLLVMPPLFARFARPRRG